MVSAGVELGSRQELSFMISSMFLPPPFPPFGGGSLFAPSFFWPNRKQQGNRIRLLHEMKILFVKFCDIYNTEQSKTE